MDFAPACSFAVYHWTAAPVRARVFLPAELTVEATYPTVSPEFWPGAACLRQRRGPARGGGGGHWGRRPADGRPARNPAAAARVPADAASRCGDVLPDDREQVASQDGMDISEDYNDNIDERGSGTEEVPHSESDNEFASDDGDCANGGGLDDLGGQWLDSASEHESGDEAWSPLLGHPQPNKHTTRHPMPHI